MNSINQPRPSFVWALLACGMISILTASAAHTQDLTGIKCVINGKKSALVDTNVEYKGGKVYFCCDHCADAFREDVKLNENAKHSLKANHQLVLTGQYVQQGCPMSGKPFDAELMTEVGGLKVGFCNADCMNQVKHADNLEAKSKFVFAEAAFKRAFKKKTAKINLAGVKCMLVPEQNIVAEHTVDYQQGQVFFCCGDCAKTFAENNEKYNTSANLQLVRTGQYVQTRCPISGGQVNASQASVVGGVTVQFCCQHCKAKVEQAKDESAQAEFVFGASQFAKAFAKR